MHPRGQLTPSEMDAVVADAQNRVRASFGAMPVFGPTGWVGPVMIGEWNWAGGAHGLAHGNPDGTEPYVQVQTHPHDARQGVNHMRAHSSGDFGSDAPPDRLTEITVDETPVLFEVWEDELGSWAGGNYLDHGIVVESRRTSIDDLSLHTVDDIEPYLRGQLDLIRRARLEAGWHEI
jgi:hypothetical protein